MTSLGFIILLVSQENLIFFYSPTEVFEKTFDSNKKIRVGGMVKRKVWKKN